jgi:SMODS-associated NUDIX domain
MAQETVRLSATVLASLQDSAGRYALLVNKQGLTRGERILTPLGGAVEVTALGKTALQQLLAVQEADFEKGNDLRIRTVAREAIGSFIAWFAARDGNARELDPRRELIEELIDESRVLPVAYKDRLANDATVRHIGYGSEFVVSKRSGTETVSIGDVCQVTLPDDILTELLHGAEQPNSPLAFASAGEIAAGQTVTGTSIGTIAKFLIHYAAYPVNPLEP